MSGQRKEEGHLPRRVLVVEDDAGLRNLILRALGKVGMEAVGAASGAEAIERLSADPAQVLLLDQKLPDMSGREIVTSLAGRGVHVYFVMMTGQGDERLAVDMMRLGAADYMLKDTDLIDRLPGVMDRVFRGIETERSLHVAEEALRESEQRFRSLFQNVPSVAVQGYALDGTVRYWNHASELLYGFSEQEAIGRNLLDLIIPAEMRTQVEESLRTMAETRSPIPSEEVQLVRKDGEKVEVESSHVVVQIPGRDPELFCIDVDLTGRKRAEEARESLQNQLNQAQKMESVGRLAGGVAHDFNNMLGVILGFTELSLDSVPPGHPLHDGLMEIRKAAERSADLTRQLLAFARKQTITPKVLDLNETVEGMLKMLRRLIGENITLTWRPCREVTLLKVDPSQIDQILVNLCVNSCDAIEGNGEVHIETSVVSFGKDVCAQHAGFLPGDFVCMQVGDTGCGMDSETMKYIFEPFFTTKKVGEGTGLGLATVYGIVRQNNGFLDVDSEKGRGTTFRIYLPRHVPAAVPAAPRPEVQPTPASGHATVLLVEDDAALLNMTRAMLVRQGYTVLPASTTAEALQLAKQHPGEIHLLMTDIVMPDMNGRDLAKTLMPIRPHLKRLFMSGYTAEVIAHHGVLDEGVRFIQKPFSMKDLVAKLRDVLEESGR